MFRKLFCLALFCALSTLAPLAFAQSDAAPASKYSLKFSPQHLLFNGVHLELEKKFNPVHSFTVSPRFYHGSTRNIDSFSRRNRENLVEAEGEVSGYGAEVQHRIYLTQSAEQVYFSYGINFHHFGIDFRRPGWGEDLGDDGLMYYRYRERDFTEKINRWGGVALIGIQDHVASDRIVLDVYGGLGYKNSSIDTNYSQPRYNYNFLDFGYTGMHFLLGLKLGVAF